MTARFLGAICLFAGGLVACSTLLGFEDRTSGSDAAAPDGVYVVTTLAGSGSAGFADGTGTEAFFNTPTGVAVDTAGNVYVADQGNHCIRKVTPEGVVTTLAGACGPTGNASFDYPAGVAVDSAGNVYVADSQNSRIRKVTSAGVVTTLAGSGKPQFADGTGSAASFNHPSGVAVDDAGNVYVADNGNSCIRAVTTPGGSVTTLAGSATMQGNADGPAAAATFNGPASVAVDAAGNVYVADGRNQRIRKVTAGGEVTPLAGSAGGGYGDGLGAAASFNNPSGTAVDGAGNVYVADQGNNRIRKVTPEGEVTTLAGSSRGYADGTSTAAAFNGPYGVALDTAGNIYVADSANHRIRKLTR